VSVVFEPERFSNDQIQSPEGVTMNDLTETMPTIVRPASATTWRLRLYRGTYIVVCAVAILGWSVALSWVAFSFLRLVVNQFT
jgi:hypothetical protein